MAQKRFKPLPHNDQDKDQRKLIAEIEANWNSHPWVKNKFGYWREYMAWYDGDQYTWYNKDSDTVFDLTPIVERETKSVYNRILPIIRQQWAEIRYDHSYYVEPSTTEAEDIKAAKIGSNVIEYLKSRYLFASKVNQAKLWALILGTVFWKVWWNKKGQGYVMNDRQAVPVPGDVDFMYVVPFNCRPDPLGKERGEWRFFTEGKVVSLSSLAEEFDIPVNMLAPESVAGFEDSLFVNPDGKSSKEPQIVRKEHWIAKSKQNPQGRMIVAAGGWMLYDGPNPSPGHTIPYFTLKGVLPRLGEVCGDSSVRIAQPAQRKLNRYCSMVDEHVENFRIKGLIPYGSLTGGNLTHYKRIGVDFVEFNPRAGQPYFQAPPGIPETTIGWIRFQENEIETETSVRKVSLGELPKYASRASGVLFQGLRAQDTAVLVPGLEEMDQTLGEAWSLALELVQKHYDERRLVKIVGKNREASVVYVKGAELRGNTDVRVKSGIDVFSTRQKKEEVVTVMLERGVITEPKQAFDLLEMRSPEEFMEDEFIDERQARRQLDIMKTKDTYIEPYENDNHELMFKIFNNFRKTEEFSTISEKCQKNILKRIEEEKAFTAPEAKPTETGPTPAAATTKTPEEQAAEDAMKEAAEAGGVGPGGVPPGLPPELANLPPEVMQVLLSQLGGGAGAPTAVGGV